MLVPPSLSSYPSLSVLSTTFFVAFLISYLQDRVCPRNPIDSVPSLPFVSDWWEPSHMHSLSTACACLLVEEGGGEGSFLV